MKLPRIRSLVMDVGAGTHVFDSQREAVAMSIEHECDVRFVHNDRRFDVRYKDLMACVLEHPPATGEQHE